MARVVERRKVIPWAIIIFVFLFLVAATLAVLWRIDLDDRTAAIAESKEKLDLYTRMAPQPLEEPAKSVWKRQKDSLEPMLTEGRKPGGRGVIQQLMDREQPLIDVIGGVGSAMTPEQAAAKGRDVIAPRAAGDPGKGLTQIAEAATVEAAALQEKVRTLEQARDAAITEGKNLGKQLEDVRAAHDKETGDLKGQLTASTSEKGEIDKKQQAELAKIKKEYEDRIEKLNADSNRYQGEIDKNKSELRKMTAQLAGVTRRLDEFVKPKKMRTMNYQACGQVIETKLDERIVYINLGEKDRITPGLTFAVYPGERGMPLVVKAEPGTADTTKFKGKAQLYVLQVMEKVSQCRIEWMANPDDPIVKGDLIGNLAFDRERTFRFAVIGDFDLYSSGKSQDADSDHIKFLIRRYRGEVSKDLDDQTDYLILGSKPAEVPAMEGEESPQMVKARQEKEKRRAEYERIRKLAEARDLPILNANEFLSLVGYTPQNTLKPFGAEGR
ncbi:MAG: hypothetical protein NT031_19250 [Planctomycetota bacterium]|nr:hypothetical protein [Planctomycetota bacterium]